MIKYQNNTISRMYGGNTPAYTLISGGTCVHGEYVHPSNTELTTLNYSTPSGIIDTKTNLNASANTGVELIYSSSDTSIATVDSNGQIAPKASGTTTITITASGTTIGNTTYRGAQKRLEVECDAPASPPAWDADFLTIEAENPSTTITLKNPSNKNIWYRKDNETEYTEIPQGDTSITIENANGYIKLYGDNEGVGISFENDSFQIYCEMDCSCYGKLTSLLSSGCPGTIYSTDTDTFSYLFYQSRIVDASGLILPNNVSDYCYYSMFQQCTSLVNPPSILPATTLAEGCYSSMFEGCTSLTQAPQLPATTLAQDCYESMFEGCTSLTQAPSLPATTLAETCYYGMFRNCSNLSTVTLYYTDSAPTTGQGYFYSWLYKAGGTGCTIYAPANALWNSSDSTMYIPSNWTVEKIL